jgi:hypothetical protein
MRLATTRGIILATVPHGILVGLLLGLSTSPIASVFLPLLLGIGGYKAIATLPNPTDDTGDPLGPSGESRRIWATTIGVWSLVVIVALLLGITMRTGQLPLQPRPRSTLSYASLGGIPPVKLLPLIIVAKYYDQVTENPSERRIIARALTSSGVDPTQLIPQLETLTGSRGDTPTATSSPGYGVFDFHVNK